MIGEQYERRTRLKVLKVRGGEVYEVAARRNEPLGFITHWVGRANYMCPGERCPACMDAIGARWVGMLPVVHLQGGTRAKTVLLELTGSAWTRLDGLLRMDGGTALIGVPLRVQRRKNREALILDPSLDVEREKIREFPDWALLDAIGTLYHLPRCLEDWDAATWTAAARDVACSKLQSALDRMAR